MLLKPFRAAIVLVILWELFIGLLYPISGLPETEHASIYQVFRFLERFGDYAGPLALLYLMSFKLDSSRTEKAPVSASQLQEVVTIA